MTGEMVADAQAATQSDTTTSGSKYVVQLKLNDEGAKIFSEKTGEYLNKVLQFIMMVSVSVIRRYRARSQMVKL